MKLVVSIFLILSSFTTYAHSSDYRVGDVVLFQTRAASGRGMRVARTIYRVGIIQEVRETSAIIQEINYPTRQGEVVYREIVGGLERYDGTHEVSQATLLPSVTKLTSVEGQQYLQGSPMSLIAGRSKVPGYVVYAFSKGEQQFIAITDQRGWNCIQEFGETCHERVAIRLTVRGIWR